MQTTYQAAGVDTEKGRIGLQRIVDRVRGTWPQHDGIGAVKLPIGYYANVIDMGGIGLALATDGIGSKAVIAQMMQTYDTVGIDCIAMNVNDLLCVGATPLSLVDYIAVQEPAPEVLDALSRGLCAGAEMANISISGGEIAQLPDIIKGHDVGVGFDLVGTAVGRVGLDQILIGQHIEPGDVVVGIESNGIHSNGLTLARHIFFERHGHRIDASFAELDRTLGEELLQPTHVYVREALDAFTVGASAIKACLHITGDGFLNLNRVAADVGYRIDTLLPVPPIFSLIQQLGQVSDEEMFRVFNMGVGFCLVVAASSADAVMAAVQVYGKKAAIMGHVVADAERRIVIEPKGLIGAGKQFVKQTR